MKETTIPILKNDVVVKTEPQLGQLSEYIPPPNILTTAMDKNFQTLV